MHLAPLFVILVVALNVRSEPARVVVTTTVTTDPRSQRFRFQVYERVDSAATLAKLYDAIASFATFNDLDGPVKLTCKLNTGVCTGRIVSQSVDIRQDLSTQRYEFNVATGQIDSDGNFTLPQTYLKAITATKAIKDLADDLDGSLPVDYKIVDMFNAYYSSVSASGRRKRSYNPFERILHTRGKRQTLTCGGQASGYVTLRGFAAGALVSYAQTSGQVNLDTQVTCDLSGVYKTIKENFNNLLAFSTEIKDNQEKFAKETVEAFTEVADLIDAQRQRHQALAASTSLNLGQYYNTIITSSSFLVRVADRLTEEAIIVAALSNQFTTKPIDSAFVPKRYLAAAVRKNSTFSQTYVYGTANSYTILIVVGQPSNYSAKLINVHTKQPGCDEQGCFYYPNHDYILTNNSLLKADTSEGDWQADPLHITPRFVERPLTLDLKDGVYQLDRSDLSQNLTNDYVRSFGGACIATCVSNATCKTSLGDLSRGQSNSACRIGDISAIPSDIVTNQVDYGKLVGLNNAYANQTVSEVVVTADETSKLRSMVSTLNTTATRFDHILAPEFVEYFGVETGSRVYGSFREHEQVSTAALIIAILDMIMVLPVFYYFIKYRTKVLQGKCQMKNTERQVEDIERDLRRLQAAIKAVESGTIKHKNGRLFAGEVEIDIDILRK